MEEKSGAKRILQSKMFMFLVITAALVGVICLILMNFNFLKFGNVRAILKNMCVSGIMLVAVLPLLMGGGIDLSSAQQAGLGALVFAQMMTSFPSMPWLAALLIALLAGACFGLINVFLVNVLGFMPFIATIGMSSIYSGVALVWARGAPIMITAQSFTMIGTKVFFKVIPLLFVIMVLILGIYSFVLSFTHFGRSVYMVGGNEYAARLSGLNPKRIRAILFINSGVMSALAGIAWASQMKLANSSSIISAAPNMQALSAGILGGVAFSGGAGGLSGAFAALLLLNVFQNGIAVLSVPSYYNVMLQGLILIVALIADSMSTMSAKRALIAAAVKGGDAK